MAGEKEYIVPVAWEMVGFLKVKASSAEEAFDKVFYDKEDYPLPDDGYYVDGSFSPSCDNHEMVEDYTRMYDRGELKV